MSARKSEHSSNKSSARSQPREARFHYYRGWDDTVTAATEGDWAPLDDVRRVMYAMQTVDVLNEEEIRKAAEVFDLLQESVMFEPVRATIRFPRGCQLCYLSGPKWKPVISAMHGILHGSYRSDEMQELRSAWKILTKKGIECLKERFHHKSFEEHYKIKWRAVDASDSDDRLSNLREYFYEFARSLSSGKRNNSRNEV